MMEIEECRPRTQRHRASKRRRKRESKTKFGLADILLLIWSAASLASFFYLFDKIESAPVWQIIALALSTLVGLVLFIWRGFSSKK